MKNNVISVKLKSVKKSDCEFLYDLLKERDPRANISHKKMPSFTQHVKFVMSKPYSKWYIIEAFQNPVGSVYLTKDNEIGIFVKKDFHSKGIASAAINLLMEKHPRSRYLANINPKNKKSIQFFKNQKFNLIQHTYELEK
ncbi:GNAT family N-acetyltransferase [Nitrosopumilus sp.]|uniref:GNAT family N-acetyltransferase n=1 Tax=Nitrosopumilus sp. TaxID=2024843 RepID=UPI00242DD64E|nr:GNAT family N-acetyltransferase [Nitrosopumilus sp.]MCV0366645.1 GNAT family N-acetyltransferase [Nitrosopumilus sp.]MCV0410568.1 GNAT family N-acetyltransferase [Nitrosopumilus sp.]